MSEEPRRGVSIEQVNKVLTGFAQGVSVLFEERNQDRLEEIGEKADIIKQEIFDIAEIATDVLIDVLQSFGVEAKKEKGSRTIPELPIQRELKRVLRVRFRDLVLPPIREKTPLTGPEA